jgi:hypothetical protein
MPQKTTNPKEFAQFYLEAVLIAADPKTKEEKARVAWRFTDHISIYGRKYGYEFADALRDLLREKNIPQPQSNSHWSEAEYHANFKESQKLFG